MSRLFNGPTTADRITFGVGSGAVPPDEGPITVAALCRFTGSATTGTYWLVEGNTSANVGIWGLLVDTNKWFIDNDFTAGGPTLIHSSWMWVVVTKASGSSTPRWHIRDIGAAGAWSHTNGAGAVGDGTGTLSKILVGGPSNTTAANTWQGDVAAIATWTAVLTDLQIEAACTLAASDLKAAVPGSLWRFNQASTGTAVNDDMPGGANQTAISGTSVDSSEATGWNSSITSPYHLWSTQTPAAPDVNESQNTTVATAFTLTEAGSCVGGEFYGPVTVSGTFAVELWQVTADDSPADTGTGTLLASATAGTVTASAWNTVMFSSPVALDTTHTYRLALATSAGRYAATGAFFASAPLINGNIVAPKDQGTTGIGTVANGTYLDASITGYPLHTFNSTAYLVGPLMAFGAVPWTKDVVETYRVFAGFTKDVVERYRVTNGFTKDVVERYRVTNAIAKDVIERYRLYAGFTKDVAETYRVTNGFTKDVVETYRVTNAFTKDVVERYRVTNALTLDVVERYRVFAGFTKDVVETYNVLGGTAWTKDVVERYRITNAFTKDVVERYRVTNALTKDVVERYRLFAGFTKDVVETYNVLGGTAWSKDIIERYRVYATFTGDVVERYRILNPLAKDVVERYRVLNGLSKDVVERYRVYASWTRDLVERYKVLSATPPVALRTNATAYLTPSTARAMLAPAYAVADLDDVTT